MTDNVRFFIARIAHEAGRESPWLSQVSGFPIWSMVYTVH
jgi:hypothetical protein